MKTISFFFVISFLILTSIARLCAEPASDNSEVRPQAGQTLPDFKKSVTSNLAAQGDQMGFSLQLCPLRPRLYPDGQTYLSRAFSQRTDTTIALIGVEQGKVTHWREFDLPNLDGWITHYAIKCEGTKLKVGKGRSAQFYIWTGKNFLKNK